mmetsp:Transcript_14682/g.44325  ORF Transcript_14682/g.44325 Transcript_14682/m.44325 type:complete len:462 (+) Transcript_14682:410-1795(+)
MCAQEHFSDTPPALERRGTGSSSDYSVTCSPHIRTASLAIGAYDSYSSLLHSAGGAYISPDRLTSVRPLGEGKYSDVELATLAGQYGQPDTQVAVKHLKPQFFDNGKSDAADFVAEGKLLASLHHPSIVTVVGMGFHVSASGQRVDKSSAFICMEPCLHGSLRDLVRHQMKHFNKVVYKYADALRWALQLAEGLDHMHSRSPMLLHRDVKLDNVLIIGDDDNKSRCNVKLSDLGLATEITSRQVMNKARHLQETTTDSELIKATNAESSSTAASVVRKMLPGAKQSSITHNGHLRMQPCNVACTASGTSGSHSLTRKLKAAVQRPHEVYDLTGQTGSFLNLAPEVALNRPYNEKCDIFSLGVCLYEMFSKSILAAEITYTGSDREFEIYCMRVARGYRRPHPVNWGEGLRALVSACMAQEAEDRPSAAEVIMMLRALRESGEIEVMDTRPRRGCTGGCMIQ